MGIRSESVRHQMAGALGAAVAVLGVSLPSAAHGQVTQDLFVPSWTQQRVLVLDTQTGTVIANPPLSGEPYGVAVTPDGRRAYVTRRAGNTVTVIDVATRATVATIPTDLTPRDVAITPDGTLAYVTMSGSDLVSVFEVATNKQVASIPTMSMPWGIAITPDGTRALVANRMANTVSLIDIRKQAVDGELRVGQEPVEVAIAPDGKTAYVSSTLDNTVVPIDLGTMEVQPPILVGTFPRALAVTPDGNQIVVACSDNNTISIIDRWTLAVTSLPTGANSLPSGVAISPDGRVAYIGTQGMIVGGQWTSKVLTIDLASKTIVGAVSTNGQALRVGLTPNMIVPASGVLSVANDDDLTKAGFVQHVVFNGGTLRATSILETKRTVSLLAGGGTIDTQGFNVEVDGGVINDGALVKRGAGTLSLGGTSTHPGTDVQQGALTLFGAVHQGKVTLHPGTTLSGTGSVGDLDAPDAIITPGDKLAGLLVAQNITMTAGSALIADIGPGLPGTGYDQLVAVGMAALNGAILKLRVIGNILPGAAFTIVTNTTGAFGGLPEGAVVSGPGGLTHFHITYLGGSSGHDVVLTAF
jgi:YVTN family beta-propeller protein/autotransporter-associated beta strand protein